MGAVDVLNVLQVRGEGEHRSESSGLEDSGKGSCAFTNRDRALADGGGGPTFPWPLARFWLRKSASRIDSSRWRVHQFPAAVFGKNTGNQLISNFRMATRSGLISES